MTEEQLKKVLAQDTGEVPPRFHQAMLTAFAQMQEDTAEPTLVKKKHTTRHVPRQGSGRFRRLCVVMLVALGLLGGLAGAATVNPRLLEVFWGKDFEPNAQAAAYIAQNVAQEDFGDYRVSIQEAVYDGMSLYIRYAIRDMNCDHLLGELDVDTGRRTLQTDEPEDFSQWPVGWWTDNLWIDGQEVAMPGMSSSEMWAGDENGEVVVSEMYRLDQVGLFLSGDVRIALPIGEKQYQVGEEWTLDMDENGKVREPEKGIVAFNLNCDAPVRHYAAGEKATMPDGTTVWVETADDTLMKLYVTVHFALSDAAREAYRAENGEGYVLLDSTVLPFEDGDMVGAWMSNLTLVDEDGKPLRAHLGYGEGCWSLSNDAVGYVFAHEEAYPAHLYLAPENMDGTVDMTRAIPMPIGLGTARVGEKSRQRKKPSEQSSEDFRAADGT